MERLTRFARNACIILLVSAALFVLAEGAASALFVASGIQAGPMAERMYTRYDPELGWASIPNVYIKDVYGPSLDLRTNSRGFRNAQEFSNPVPTGKLRIICSGDSFTLGYGVDNDHTWCQLLATHDPRLETVNMGQGGYGLDQAYLWYERDGRRLDHNVHILAAIGEDFRRMERSDFLGYAKPTLALRNGALVAEHVPVRRRMALIPWLYRNHGAVEELRSVWLLSAIAHWIVPPVSAAAREPAATPAEKLLVRKLLESLDASNARQHSAFVFVYLPAEEDLDKDGWRAEWRAFLRERAAEGLRVIDLTDDFLNLPVRKLNGMFIHDAAHGLATGHYTARGNEFVAERLSERLRGMEVLRKKP